MSRNERKAVSSLTLPAEVFQLFASLFPEFKRIEESCAVSGIELFILLYLRHRGRYLPEKKCWCILRADFTALLAREFSYERSDVDQQLRRMEKKELLSRQRLTSTEKMMLFETTKGRLAIVTLSPKGISRIDEVEKQLRRLFETKLRSIPAPVRGPFLKLAMPEIRRTVDAMLALAAAEHEHQEFRQRLL